MPIRNPYSINQDGILLKIGIEKNLFIKNQQFKSKRKWTTPCNPQTRSHCKTPSLYLQSLKISIENPLAQQWILTIPCKVAPMSSKYKNEDLQYLWIKLIKMTNQAMGVEINFFGIHHLWVKNNGQHTYYTNPNKFTNWEFNVFTLIWNQCRNNGPR